MATKYDVKRQFKKCYSPKNTDWELVDIPELHFLAIDGHGDPNTSVAYRHAVEALYAVAYSAKFASKGDLGRDFVVGPLEGLWWADDMDDFLARLKDNWRWRLLISVPDWITGGMIEDAKDTARTKKKLPAIEDVRSETLHEGTSVQVLHIGPYDDETPILTRLHHEYLPANNLRERGLHHEIYLSDPRRTDPAKLRTVLRQPVEAQSG
ncbi:GyrI-like domain-containing protein [Streptomyces ferrugineus]|uniref:GyrI-like domain-containing protein n=1 Tax=Streptomyces ferrugineus TaxID=1413221 RepID=A0A7M2SCU6_9ACTN|nr:GyrI-like domain-containing protein [Streptomyces ferrugineus]QOV33318.1 GyrI-like domain-containing protein [Streptomyces ferrugineus]